MNLKIKAALNLFSHSSDHQIQMTSEEILEYAIALEATPEVGEIGLQDLIKELSNLIPVSPKGKVRHYYTVGRDNGVTTLSVTIFKLAKWGFDWYVLIQQLDDLAAEVGAIESDILCNNFTNIEYKYWIP